MCGIAGGVWRKEIFGIDAKIESALNSLQHRGPNDKGQIIECSYNSTIALGHRRLSIIDLTSNGHQPMVSVCGRYSIVFNGEIYNYKELRDELCELGCDFITNTDTEVLLNAIITWDLSCLPKLIGMFAFAFYDRKKRTIVCARDAFGIKPLFYICNEENFLFASEQSALLKLSEKNPKVDWQRSYDYLSYGDYDSQERTFFEGIQQLLPAHHITVQVDTRKMSDPFRWWYPNVKELSTMSFSDASITIRDLFMKNIQLHLRSDVPIGVALSGGIDSSAVACAVRHLEPDSKIHTFSYISSEQKISEEYWVDKVNAYVGATAHKVSLTFDDLALDLDEMIRIQGEPFGSTSIYAQYRVFQLSKQCGITVMLEGQGADELMAGYIGYPGQRILSLLEEGDFLDVIRFIKNWSQWPGRSTGQALLQLGEVCIPDDLYKIARKIIGIDSSRTWLDMELLRGSGIILDKTRMPLLKEAKARRVMAQLKYSLQNRGLPGLLRHADRNSMAFSIESRVPFLTLPLADFLFSLPEKYLISNSGETKSIFRESMKGIVPNEILYRKDKIGFSTPEKDWILRSAPLFRNWLNSSENIPFINHKELISSFDSVVEGKSKFTADIWRSINFVRWHHLYGF
jgi:asparagine synthase (glutamine-hydrolysing)